jgi:hypothetical protein
VLGYVLHDIIGNVLCTELKEDFFCVDGKIRILIASSLIALRFYPGKSMPLEFLIVFCLEA